MRIRRSVDISRTSVLAIPVSEEKIQDPNFILSDDFQQAFDTSLHIDTKLKLIAEVLKGKFTRTAGVPKEFANVGMRPPLEFAGILMHSVLAEIMQEQMTIRPFEFSSKVPKETLWHKLAILSRVANYDYGQTELNPDTDEGKLWLNFIAQLSYFSTDAVTTTQRWTSRLFGWIWGRSKNVEVTDITNALIDRMIQGVFSDSQMEDVKLRVKDIVQEIRNRNNGQKGIMALQGLNLAKESNYRNGEIQVEDPSRVRSQEDQQGLQSETVARRQRGEGVKQSYSAEKAHLALPPAECEAILQRRANRAKN